MKVFRVVFNNGMVMDFPVDCWLVNMCSTDPGEKECWEVRQPFPAGQGPPSSRGEGGDWVCTVRNWIFFGDVDKEVDVESVRDNLKEIQDGLS